MVNFANSVLFGLMATAALAEPLRMKHAQHHKKRKPCSTTAPYAMGNGTTPTGPTGTGATTTIPATSFIYSTVTVIPVPAGPSGGSEAGAGSGATTTQPVGKNGNGDGAGSACGAATVTVTFQNTVTVTAAAAPSSIPAVSSSSAAAVVAPSPPAPSPPAASPVMPSPLPMQASTSSSVAAAVSIPAVNNPSPPSQPSPSPVQASSSAAASPTDTPSGSTGKLGVIWDANGQVGSGTPFTGANANWGSNWYYSSGGNLDGIEYIPTLQKPEWTSSLVAAIPQETNPIYYVKSVNEPDMLESQGGTDMAPGDAVAIHTGTLNTLGAKYKIATPAVSAYNTTSSQFTGRASGITWLQQWYAQCGNCQVDVMDLHWYSEGGSLDDQTSAFITYVTQAVADAHNMFGPDVEVWISEFSALPMADSDPQLNADFYTAVKPTLEKLVNRYAYYKADLLTSNGQLNAAGTAFFATGS